MKIVRAFFLLLLVSAPGCAYQLPSLSPRVHDLPQRLSEAGLYSDASMTTVGAEYVPYTPAFELWSDGASKRRWMRLPAGACIDTTNIDDWVFPVGTQLWKEFSVDGRRIETRLLTRLDPSDDGWVGLAYVWNAEQTDAIATIDGVSDALGTDHDVPQARACMTCHGGRASVVLGVSAIQLAHPATPGEASLDTLVAAGQLTAPPSAPIVMGGSGDEIAALGYLHANCAPCHNGARPEGHDSFRPHEHLDFWLTTATVGMPASTPTVVSAIEPFIRRGRPEDSQIVERMRGPVFMHRRMPPIATERVDDAGLALVRRWIQAMPPAHPAP